MSRLRIFSTSVGSKLLNGQTGARLLAYSGAPVFAPVTLNASSD